MACLFSCNTQGKREVSVKDELTINDIVDLPEEIEGCSCYLSRNDSSFNQQKHIFALSDDSVAYVMINNKLNRVKMVYTNHHPFTFKNHDILEKYANDNYTITVNAQFEDSTSFESWNFKGKITIEDKTGDKANVDFVGACGC
ncbi:MAG: hypothetical protein ACJA0U_001784 [Salibacteraceae bacterium]|jgi:hypothetical protein